MKPALLILFAITLHLATKFFWDFGYDYSLYSQLREARESMDILWVNDVLDKIEIQEREGANRFSLGITLIIFTWVYLRKIEFEITPKLRIIIGGWLVWAGNDVLKEICYKLNILQWFFANPTIKNLHEYIAFLVSVIFILWQLRRLKRSR